MLKWSSNDHILLIYDDIPSKTVNPPGRVSLVELGSGIARERVCSVDGKECIRHDI